MRSITGCSLEFPYFYNSYISDFSCFNSITGFTSEIIKADF